MLKKLQKQYKIFRNLIIILYMYTTLLVSTWAVRPLGLENLDNISNVVLQSISNIKPLKKFLLKNDNIYKPNSLASSYIAFLKRYKAESVSNKLNNPHSKTENLQAVEWFNYLQNNKILHKWQKHDAGELLNILLDHLARLDLKATKKNFTKLRLDDLLNIKIENNEYKKSKLINSKITVTHEIKLPIVSKYADVHVDSTFSNIEAALDNYFSKETKILKLPQILVIRYDRVNPFNLDIKTNIISNGVTFPINMLSLEKYLSPNADKNQVTKYNLSAIIMQYDQGIHYTTYLKHNNQWYLCDNLQITPISTIEIENLANSQLKKIDPAPYILIYERLDNLPEHILKSKQALKTARSLYNRISKYKSDFSINDKKNLDITNGMINKLKILLNERTTLAQEFNISKNNKIKNNIKLLDKNIALILSQISANLNQINRNLTNNTKV